MPAGKDAKQESIDRRTAAVNKSVRETMVDAHKDGADLGLLADALEAEVTDDDGIVHPRAAKLLESLRARAAQPLVKTWTTKQEDDAIKRASQMKTAGGEPLSADEIVERVNEERRAREKLRGVTPKEEAVTPEQDDAARVYLEAYNAKFVQEQRAWGGLRRVAPPKPPADEAAKAAKAEATRSKFRQQAQQEMPPETPAERPPFTGQVPRMLPGGPGPLAPQMAPRGTVPRRKSFMGDTREEAAQKAIDALGPDIQLGKPVRVREKGNGTRFRIDAGPSLRQQFVTQSLKDAGVPVPSTKEQKSLAEHSARIDSLSQQAVQAGNTKLGGALQAVKELTAKYGAKGPPIGSADWQTLLAAGLLINQAGLAKTKQRPASRESAPTREPLVFGNTL
jgi:hypothetical protein